MNPTELKCARVRRKRSPSYMGKAIGRTAAAWRNRERGEVDITVRESAVISNNLELTEKEFFDIFYDGKLPFIKKI